MHGHLPNTVSPVPLLRAEISQKPFAYVDTSIWEAMCEATSFGASMSGASASVFLSQCITRLAMLSVEQPYMSHVKCS
uniref:Uncharacterized protein n=1 Tax=Oryza glumipatula TaxID=40148 RepID=A0A0D9Z7X0_9ORYZ